jgi:endoglucanase
MDRARDRGRGRLRLASRALAFAFLCVAGAALPATPASAAETTVASPEAEQGVLDGWSIRKVADASASGGSAVRYDWAGAVKLDVRLPADAGRIRLRMRGDQCAGAPEYTLTVDKAAVGRGSVTSTSWADRSHDLVLPAGLHSVEVRFTNDYSQWRPSCDRNLYLDSIAFSSSGAVALKANPAVPAGFVHQSGTRLVDGAGKPLRLRGVNVGGWLHWEGWMWGQGFDYIGESAMMRNLAGLVGPAAAERFRSDVRANFMTAADFRALSVYGLNVVRVPINYRLLEDDTRPFAYKQSGWDALDQAVAAAKQHNVYLIPDMQAAPCSQTYSFTSDYVGPEYLWSSSACQDRLVAVWKAIAARYANENVIAGYDLLNETVVGDDQLLSLYKRLTAAIRSVDHNHLLIYEGSSVARRFDLFATPLDSNQMLSFHDYAGAFPGQDITARMVAYDAAAKRLNTPVWAGEFGQTAYEDVQKYVDAFDADPLMAGWAQWTWKQSPGFPALQTIQHTAASKKLIDWMNNTSRPRPTDAEATQGTADFVRAIRFENTTHDAKLRGIMQCRVNCQPAAVAPTAIPAPQGAPAATTPVRSTRTGTGATAAVLAASARPATLTAALRTGVQVSLNAPGPGRLQLTATRAAKVVARGTAAATAAGPRAVTLRFTTGARTALRGARRVALTIRATYRPRRGAAIGQRLRVTLVR